MRLVANAIQVQVGERVLHSDLSFQVNSGRSLALMGPSGSGKSTLLATIAGYRDISKGRIDFTGMPANYQIQWLVQSTPLLTRRTVWDNVTLAARIRGLDANDLDVQANLLLRQLSIDALKDTPVHRLSGGERQRVAIVRTILSKASVVLADEPTASLDPTSRDQVIQALLEVPVSGAMLVVATHDPRVAEACDQILTFR